MGRPFSQETCIKCGPTRPTHLTSTLRRLSLRFHEAESNPGGHVAALSSGRIRGGLPTTFGANGIRLNEDSAEVQIALPGGGEGVPSPHTSGPSRVFGSSTWISPRHRCSVPEKFALLSRCNLGFLCGGPLGCE